MINMQNDSRNQKRMPTFLTPIYMAEILATKLETNENIIRIRINDCEIRNIQHADDVTIIVQDENSSNKELYNQKTKGIHYQSNSLFKLKKTI